MGRHVRIVTESGENIDIYESEGKTIVEYGSGSVESTSDDFNEVLERVTEGENVDIIEKRE